MNREVIKDFFDGWELYDRVLDYNYMFHDEIYRDVANALTKRFWGSGFSILDLGCGSARHLAPALAGCAVNRYVGCDISQVALDHARQNLQGLGCAIELHQTDLADGIASGEDKFDVVFSSFALHHLSAAGKELFFRQTRRRLAAGGILLLIDVARKESEDRAAYMDAYCGWIQSEWTRLPQQALDFIFDHIRNNDFPETETALRSMAATAGFTNGRALKSALWHHLWEYE